MCSTSGIWDEHREIRDEQVKVKDILKAVILWIGILGLLFLIQVGLDGMAIPDKSLQELLNTFGYGLGCLAIITGLQHWQKWPPLFHTQWYLFHIVLSAFSYLIFDSIFVELKFDSGSSFTLKASSLGSSYIDKVLGNGFSIYVILVALFALVNRKKQTQIEPEPDSVPSPGRAQFKIKLANRTYFIDTESVLFIRSAQNYSELFTLDRKHVVRETLSRLEETLDPALFMRIHRSVIINIHEVAEFESTPNGQYRVRLQDGTLLNVGNKFKKKVQAHFQL